MYSEPRISVARTRENKVDILQWHYHRQKLKFCLSVQKLNFCSFQNNMDESKAVKITDVGKTFFFLISVDCEIRFFTSCVTFHRLTWPSRRKSGDCSPHRHLCICTAFTSRRLGRKNWGLYHLLQ